MRWLDKGSTVNSTLFVSSPSAKVVCASPSPFASPPTLCQVAAAGAAGAVAVHDGGRDGGDVRRAGLVRAGAAAHQRPVQDEPGGRLPHLAVRQRRPAAHAAAPRDHHRAAAPHGAGADQTPCCRDTALLETLCRAPRRGRDGPERRVRRR
eukprot:6889754-Pyramimonas_sp.AAC.2